MAKTKEVHCKYCGKLFKQKYPSQEYCSTICKDTNGGKINKQRWADKYYENPKICPHCKKIIPYESRRNIFCCQSCRASFNNSKRIITEEHKKKTSDTLIKLYTNRETSAKDRVCKVCGKIYKNTKYNSATNNCCSKECSKYLNDHKVDFLSKEAREKMSENMRKNLIKMGDMRRSKNEIYFYELCEKYFNNVEHNKPLFNGWDADVIIHDIKYAILWNGVWHRRKITNKHSVKQVQNRDKIKICEIKKYGYIPYIIEDDGQYNKKFVQEKFDEFINHINN